MEFSAINSFIVMLMRNKDRVAGLQSDTSRFLKSILFLYVAVSPYLQHSLDAGLFRTYLRSLVWLPC